MKHGAYHYANKPFNVDEIALLVEKALETTQLRREVRALRATQARPYSLDRIVGVSPAITVLRALLQKIAASPASTVLLTGESGTGKDLAAKVLHYISTRSAADVQQWRPGTHLAGGKPHQRVIRCRPCEASDRIWSAPRTTASGSPSSRLERVTVMAASDPCVVQVIRPDMLPPRGLLQVATRRLFPNAIATSGTECLGFEHGAFTDDRASGVRLWPT